MALRIADRYGMLRLAGCCSVQWSTRPMEMLGIVRRLDAASFFSL